MPGWFVEMASFSIGDIRFHYEVLGEGLPLIYSHGLSGSAERIREFVQDLPGVQSIIYDNRAHGRTAPLGQASDLTFDRMSLDMVALMDHLELHNAVIGGVSMGAGIALAFALRWPHRVRALILNRPAWLDSPSPDNLAFARIIADLIERYGKENAVAAFRTTAYYSALNGISPKTVESLIATMQEADPRMLVMQYRSVPTSAPVDSMERLRQVRVPSLVLGNHDDPIHPLRIAEALASHLPEATLRMISSRYVDAVRHLAEFRAEVVAFISNIARAQAHRESV